LQALVVVVLAGLVAGCGGDGESGDTGATTPPTVAPPTITATVPATTATTATTGTTGATGTTAGPAPQTERERIADCLKGEGYRLQGGAPQTQDRDSPEYQIIFSGPRGGGYIGFYKNQSRAMRVAKQLRRNALRTSGAAVERHGAINIVWVDLPGGGARTGVRGCLVT
jgi:hypothetical protein